MYITCSGAHSLDPIQGIADASCPQGYVRAAVVKLASDHLDNVPMVGIHPRY